jgi:hypothetical protein
MGTRRVLAYRSAVLAPYCFRLYYKGKFVKIERKSSDWFQ